MTAITSRDYAPLGLLFLKLRAKPIPGERNVLETYHASTRFAVLSDDREEDQRLWIASNSLNKRVSFPGDNAAEYICYRPMFVRYPYAIVLVTGFSGDNHRVVNLLTGDESALYSYGEAHSIVCNAAAGNLKGSFQ